MLKQGKNRLGYSSWIPIFLQLWNQCFVLQESSLSLLATEVNGMEVFLRNSLFGGGKANLNI